VRPWREAPPAFLFFGVFTGFPELFPVVRDRIVARHGPLHPLGESEELPFPETRTYAPTMGSGLRRKLFVLDRPWPQDGLAAVKHESAALEQELARAGRYPVARPVNIDPGLINDCRILLSSTKDYAHRIYRGRGTWEEVTLVFEGGSYRPLPWTYPDFRSPAYHAFLAPLRQDLLARQKRPEWVTSSAPPPAPPPGERPPA